MQMTYEIPHMEGIDETAKIFGLSSYTVRKLARSKRGAAFTVKIGSRYLINQAKFAAFLNCEPLVGNDPCVVPQDPRVVPAEPSVPPANGIQPVPVKL